jgi:hypothetical protein
MLPTMLRFLWLRGFRGEDFYKLTNQKQNSPMAAMFLTGRNELGNLYRFLPNFGSFGKAVSEEKLKM